MPVLKSAKCPRLRCGGSLSLPGPVGTLFTWFAPPRARCPRCGGQFVKARNGRWVSVFSKGRSRR